MLKNYLPSVLRNFRRNPFFFLINIFGLAIGICASLVIYLIVQYELDFEKVHKNIDKVYRVVTRMEFPGLTSESSAVPAPTPASARSRIPGLETVAHLLTVQEMKVAIPRKEQSDPAVFRKQDKVVYADGKYFKVFGYEWLAGSAVSSLNEPFQVVLTDSRARLYFGNIPFSEVIGQTIVYNDTLKTTVAGVVKRFVRPTELIFEEFISLNTVLEAGLKDQWDWDEWGAVNNSQMLVKLAAEAVPVQIERQLNKMRDELRHKDVQNPRKDYATHFLQRFEDIHFDAVYPGFVQMRGHKPTLYGLLVVALFLLVLGCINFINLTTANASLRAKEIGIRKTLGSGRNRLIFQFLSETFCVVLLSTIISIAMVPWLLQIFKDFIRPEISFYSVFAVHVGIFLVLLVVVVTFLAGIYPALLLTRFKPISIMRNASIVSGQSRKPHLRKALSLMQFAIAQFLLVATLFVSKQIHYSLNKDLGFNKEAIVSFGVFNSYSNNEDPRRLRLLQMLKKIPGIQMVSLAGSAPATTRWMSMSFKLSGKNRPERETNVEIKFADTNYFRLFGLKLIAGRHLVQSDIVREYVVNETYARMMGFQNPADVIGYTINERRPIVGVVSDFHSRSTREPIKPIAIASVTNNSYNFHLSLLPIEHGKWQETLAAVEQAYKKVYPEQEFKYEFYDESISAFYKAEQDLARLLKWSAGLCILISCLGLLELVTFVTNARVKEIGIRKVLGASVMTLITMLSKEFISVVLISFALIFPLGWWAMHNWLLNFEYRTPLSWWIFALVAGGMLLIALLVLSLRTVKAAMETPVKWLRSE